MYIMNIYENKAAAALRFSSKLFGHTAAVTICGCAVWLWLWLTYQWCAGGTLCRDCALWLWLCCAVAVL